MTASQRSRILLLAGWLPLLFVPVWMGAGTFRPWQSSFIPLSLWAWLCFWTAPASDLLPPRKLRIHALLQDPAIWGALLFLLLLGIQTLNTGRMRVFDFDINRYTYTPPPYPHLPSSFTRADSQEMLRWFIPVFSVFLIAKHSFLILSRNATLLWITINGLLNGLLALIHRFNGWEKMYYSLRDSGKDTYGSFGYPNHAATYFILLFSLSSGLFWREILRERSERSPLLLIFHGFAMLFFFLTAQFSASRAGILGVWLVLALLLLSLSILGWPRLHPVQRFYGAFGFLLLITAAALGFRLFAQPEHLRELQRATTDLDLGNELGARFFQVQSAWDMWKDHPAFGVGGWGYRYLAGFYLDEASWKFLGIGKANVHNDFFQFLAEFGLVGITALSMITLPPVLALLRDARKKPELDTSLWADPVRFSCSFGILLMILHSLIDLPFRSPAVFSLGMTLLLLASRPHAIQSVWPDILDWNTLTPPVRLKSSPSKSSISRS